MPDTETTIENIEHAMREGALVFSVHYSASLGTYVASAHGVLGDRAKSAAAHGATMLDAMRNAYLAFYGCPT